MKNKIEEARETINQVDKEMISLFLKRMAAAQMVAEYKIENNLPVLDSSREDALRKENLDELSNKVLEKYYNVFFDGVLKASKMYQEDLLKKLKENK